MEPCLLRILVIRLAVFALPFLGWLVWRQIARRAGRELGPTPWAWLIGGGALLAALSLVVTAFAPGSPASANYVPGQVRPDGRVGPGYFAPAKPAPDPLSRP